MRVISGKLKGKKISFINSSITRPLRDYVKENIFNVILHQNDQNLSLENSNIIILENVVGVIKLRGKSNIEIKSDFAKYNSITFDTSFYDNVISFFEDSKVSSDNLDFFFKDNKGIMYNNIRYLDRNTVANADEISFNLLNGDVKIKMFDEKKMIQIIKN